MKRFTFLFFLTVVTGFDMLAQTPYRFDAEAGAGLMSIPDVSRTGWAVRQQLTAYIRPRFGVSAGVTWGGSSNLDPIRSKASQNPYGRPDPGQLNQFYTRTDRMTDLSVVFLPVLTRRHQLAVRVGVSAYRSQASRIDSIIYYQPGGSDYRVALGQTSTQRAAPVAGASYDYRLSGRWAVGIQGSAYFGGGGQPITTAGLRTTYRFNLGADSLGLKAIDRSDVRAGVRLAANLSSANGRSVASVYGWHGVGGIWAEIPLSLTWQLRGEINYAQRGYKSIEIRQGSNRYVPEFGNLAYLELPLLFRNEVAYHWHLYGGPYLAFLLSGRAESDGEPVPIASHTVSGFMLGVDHYITTRLAIDVRYQRDLLRLSNRPYGGLHGFQLGLHYAILNKR